MTLLERDPAASRQVTTGTPAELDFRVPGGAVEGFVDAMSTVSTWSMANVGSGIQGGLADLWQTPYQIGVEVGCFGVAAELVCGQFSGGHSDLRSTPLSSRVPGRLHS